LTLTFFILILEKLYRIWIE